ncbi:hypothetical protein RRG08_008912 [Elysia crispata]|uniref:Uncharacterized protein n=1 Tax=Elysia crispata TaxID=231223 RepID=A0AAE0ZWW4_9GAST|nr:hypothetical protein RRG08_008912 [Elysia crispata]
MKRVISIDCFFENKKKRSRGTNQAHGGQKRYLSADLGQEKEKKENHLSNSCVPGEGREGGTEQDLELVGYSSAVVSGPSPGTQIGGETVACSSKITFAFEKVH